MPLSIIQSKQNGKSSQESDSECEKEVDYLKEFFCPNEASIILLEPIIQDEQYLEKDIAAILGNLIVVHTDFTLFEYNSSIPRDGDCIINQRYQSKLREQLNNRIQQGNFGIFLKFNCSSKNKRAIKHNIKIGNKIIKLIKEFINMQQKEKLQQSFGNSLDLFIAQLKTYQKLRSI
ncbi:unnamed protein product [Paramecium pentaurelia]|uniref:Uncharacterized protein n=1 Tax=Paramecium pentaurelia TaxID=43138 RepID=A0A8S1T650_9CILI|nr:unnamed protein product [Paramecium pentaurelia]